MACRFEGNDFFFQAEDGIRDLTVTGVQTCALPICSDWPAERVNISGIPSYDGMPLMLTRSAGQSEPRTSSSFCSWDQRSEERRVGKECRTQSWALEGQELCVASGENMTGRGSRVVT